MSKDIREVVRKKYAKDITAKKGCCGGADTVTSCCGTGLGKPKKTAQVGWEYEIREACSGDLLKINQLLMSTGLPTAGVESSIMNFLVATGKGGELLGVVGMEQSGVYGLLRSLAVDPGSRKQSIASALVTTALHNARGKGILALYLMTETAAKYLQRFGFAVITRAEIPETLLRDSALKFACPSSSTCMKLRLA